MKHKKHLPMFSPERLLLNMKIDLEHVTTGEALAAIRKIAGETMAQMSADYYYQRMQVVHMLAEKMTLVPDE